MNKIIVGCVIVICASFFLPWVSVEAPAVGGVSKLLTGKKQSQIDTISGFDVPIMANSDESRLMISVIKIFAPDIKDADKKSWLIWFVPGLAVILLGLGRWLGKNKWFYLAAGLIGVAIFAVATFKIVTTDLDKVVLNVKIAFGLWILLSAYLIMGIVHGVQCLQLFKKV